MFLAAEKERLAVTLRSILSGGIAHDFNNLLGGIYGYIGDSIINRHHGCIDVDSEIYVGKDQ